MSYDSDNTTNNTALLQVGDFLRRTAKERWLFAEELYIILSSSPSDLNFPLAMNPAQNPRSKISIQYLELDWLDPLVLIPFS